MPPQLQRTDRHTFNHLQYPTDIVRLAVLWRLRYKLSFRDVAELLLDRGFQVTHETVAPGSSGSLRCWPTSCGTAGAVAPASPGTSMKRT